MRKLVRASWLGLLLALAACPSRSPSAPVDKNASDASLRGATDAATLPPPPSLACSAPGGAPNIDAIRGLPRPSGSPWDIVATSADTCATAEANLRASAKAILGAPEGGVPASHVPWDHVTAPAMLDRVTERLALTKADRDLLFKNGFVALDRAAYGSYTSAFHDVFQNELPIYVSVDAVLDAVYQSNDALIADLEERKLAALLGDALAAMHGALAKAAPELPPEVASDVDLYLAVARSLLADAPVTPVLGAQPAVATLVHDAKEAKGMLEVELFGRKRVIDFSQYGPRGHYDKRAGLRRFFRAAMWTSRLELNLVSRSSRSSQPGTTPDPTETPREDLDALALADLAERSKADVKLAELDKAWGLLAGPREDVSIADLEHLRKSAGIVDLRAPPAASDLRKAIGAQFKRTLRFHYMPQSPKGSTELPAIMTLLGPRIVPDARAAMHLVDGEVPDRHWITPADFAYALGQDRAAAYLAGDFGKFPTLHAQLDVARGELMAPLACGDLYSAWFAGVRALAEKPEGVTASYMSSDAFRDLRVNETIAGFGELRHNYVLIAAQTYDEAGCEIPDGWVDPAVATYDALITYAARGAEASRTLGAAADVRYFERLGALLAVLRRIAHDELAGNALSDDEKRFLSMVVEMVPGSTGGPPTYTGWYLEMFRTLEEALDGSAWIADVFTSSDSGEIDYVGARGPVLGVFVVDAGGAPRLAVGPIARAYGHAGNVNEKRLTDATAAKLASFDSPWSVSYTSPAPKIPSIHATLTLASGAYSVSSKDALIGVVIESIDHHGAVVSSVTLDVGPKPRGGRLKVPRDGSAGLRVRVGDFSEAVKPGVVDEDVTIER